MCTLGEERAMHFCTLREPILVLLFAALVLCIAAPKLLVRVGSVPRHCNIRGVAGSIAHALCWSITIALRLLFDIGVVFRLADAPDTSERLDR